MLSAVAPTVWILVMEDSTDFNWVGYKVNAYAHFFIWAPMAFFQLGSWIFRTIGSYWLVYVFSYVTMLGPWGFQMLAGLYILMDLFDGSKKTSQWALAGAYLFYNLTMLIYSYAFIPPVHDWYYNEAAKR